MTWRAMSARPVSDRVIERRFTFCSWIKPQTQVTMVTSRPTHLTQGFKPKTQVTMVTSR